MIEAGAKLKVLQTEYEKLVLKNDKTEQNESQLSKLVEDLRA